MYRNVIRNGIDDGILLKVQLLSIRQSPRKKVKNLCTGSQKIDISFKKTKNNKN